MMEHQEGREAQNSMNPPPAGQAAQQCRCGGECVPGGAAAFAGRRSGFPEDRGLYRSENEHDACGVGLIADMSGNRTHRTVEDGIHILKSLMHRGAAGCDPDTGDGAGILVRIPDEFFRSGTASLTGLPPEGRYAVAHCFLPRDPVRRKVCCESMERIVREEGAEPLFWRETPVDDSRIGKLARESRPAICQFFVGAPEGLRDQAAFERRLYVMRRLMEKNCGPESGAADGGVYICSFSSRTIVYKGLLLASQMENFYPDLKDPLFKTSFAIVHQRYSTNTFPTWPLAHPFRCLAHNGEINTIRGNLNQMRARESHFQSPLFGEDIAKLLPVIPDGQSDSACLDNTLELLLAAGRSLPHAMLMLLPQTWGAEYHMGRDIRGFFEYHSGLMEPWDGPAAVAFTDGINLGAMLDRNGLRPARYTLSSDGFFVLASESGVLDIPPEKVLEKDRLGPGQILFLDMEKKRVLYDQEVKSTVARRQPYRRWVEENRISLHGLFDSVTAPPPGEKLLERQKIFGYTREDLNILLPAMAAGGQEATGSMGNDAALAVLSDKPQLLYNYFKQLFAQVTNPPIDPIRESLVMSIMTYIGNQGNILDESPRHAHLLKLRYPVLTPEDLGRLRAARLPTFRAATLKMAFPEKNHPEEGNSGNPGNARCSGRTLAEAVSELCDRAENAIRSGCSVLILSDRDLEEGEIPIPALLATAAVNKRLVDCRMRTSGGIVVESGEVREVMHLALLLGYGATAVCPYLALESVSALCLEGKLGNIDCAGAAENYIRALCKGILKIMSKLGISTLRSFRGAQTFEAVGLNRSLIDAYFTGTASRVGGIGIGEIESETRARYASAVRPPHGGVSLLDVGGAYRFRKDGEHHLWTPEAIAAFQRAVRENDRAEYQRYAAMINDQSRHLCTLRGLFRFRNPTGRKVPLEEVENVESILRRFVTGAMSFGSISPEAHEAIALAMNRIGGKSNSGEGGEDPARYVKRPGEISRCSAIKQVASGRFGVTAEYLANAREIQIKIAQGAKPGEGGQLPGHKVNEIIAKVRHSTPGVTLISPPPHHDIYSIEDLAELIYDLHNANPDARVSVKLVSEVGIGTIAAGVAKGHADMVLVSGHDGGTGASPLSSIKYAGLPWELGLAEVQQTLCLNKLRDRIRVQTDGQLKTGRDVMIAALLGAEEFGFATTILVCLGCVMMRKCHENSCPVGVATQNPELRKFFRGKPEYIENFLRFVAEEVRGYLSELGLHSIDEAVGRTEFLERNDAIDFWKARGLDFSAVFAGVADPSLPRKCTRTEHHREHSYDSGHLIGHFEKTLREKPPKPAPELELPIRNTDRAVGATLSYRIASEYGHAGLPEDTLKVHFRGCAGQSFGAFLAAGITFVLEGEANDFVGKSLSGGKIVIRPPAEAKFLPEKNVIAGNVIGYGACAGKIFINGMAGERFAIRNSGMSAVVEAVGDHGCEYMTGGRVVVLGKTGMNFAAGMTGGIAYVYDENGDFDLHCNVSTVDLENIEPGSPDALELRSLLEEYLEATSSSRAGRILKDFEQHLPLFVKVLPVEYRLATGKMSPADAVAVARKTDSV